MNKLTPMEKVLAALAFLVAIYFLFFYNKGGAQVDQQVADGTFAPWYLTYNNAYFAGFPNGATSPMPSMSFAQDSVRTSCDTCNLIPFHGGSQF